MARGQPFPQPSLQRLRNTVTMALLGQPLVAGQRNTLSRADPSLDLHECFALTRQARALVLFEQGVVVRLCLEASALFRGDTQLGHVLVTDPNALAALCKRA